MQLRQSWVCAQIIPSQLVTKILSQLCSIATALIIAKEWNQARCLSADA